MRLEDHERAIAGDDPGASDPDATDVFLAMLVNAGFYLGLGIIVYAIIRVAVELLGG